MSWGAGEQQTQGGGNGGFGKGFSAGKVPVLVRQYSGKKHIELQEKDGFTATVDGHEISVYKSGGTYHAIVYGIPFGRYTSKEAARKQMAGDFRAAAGRTDLELFRKRIDAVRDAGGNITPQKYAAIERKIIRESRR